MALVDSTQTKALAKKVTANLQLVLTHFSDKKKYPHKTHVVLFNVYEFTDGMMTIPKDAKTNDLCKLINVAAATLGKTVLGNHALFNSLLASFAKTNGLLVADLRTAYLGHGFNHANKACPHHDAADPSLWFLSDCIHPNKRGHHEIRRVVWRVLCGR